MKYLNQRIIKIFTEKKKYFAAKSYNKTILIQKLDIEGNYNT